jgi:hypothetical protein
MSAEKKNFIIGVGGTGMRCLETFTHMCAMGLYDGMEFNILTLDTDYENGNKGRTEALIQKYNNIKSGGRERIGEANSKTFFSAKLNLFKFVTNYSEKGNQTFKELTNISKDENGRKLADLFIDDNIQSFNLEHGYRAQTHLGSYLMYHAFIDCARRLKKGDGSIGENEKQLQAFVKGITDAAENAKIFVFGSIFGGTGASTIPVIPKAIKEFIAIESGKTATLSPDATFGSTLLTEYFSFKKPDDAQKKTDGNQVIADSSFFTLNSQAALQFYESDPTVRKTYSKMYHVGWPGSIGSFDFSKNKNDTETVTGGSTQKNQCHITEFVCGCAAWDFFNTDDNPNKEKATYYYKSLDIEEGNLNINFDDLLGDPKHGDLFEKRFGNFISLMHLILSVNQGANTTVDAVKGMLDNQGGINSVSENYKTIDKKFTTLLTEYFREFGYSLNKKSEFIPGFIYQIKSTIPGRFVLANDAFSTDTNFLFEKLDPGLLNINEDKYWKGSKKGGRFSSTTTGSDSFDNLLSLMKNIDTLPSDADSNISTPEERLIAHLYKTIDLSINKI